MCDLLVLSELGVVGGDGDGRRWSAGVGLSPAAGAFVEDGAVDGGGDVVVDPAEVEGVVAAEGEGAELRLGEEAEVNERQGREAEMRIGGIDGRDRRETHHLWGNPVSSVMCTRFGPCGLCVFPVLVLFNGNGERGGDMVVWAQMILTVDWLLLIIC